VRQGTPSIEAACGLWVNFASRRRALCCLRELDPERLRYEGSKPGPSGDSPLLLTLLQLLDWLAALVLPRVHHYRHFDVPARTAARGKLPRRPQTAAAGRSATLLRPPKTDPERRDRVLQSRVRHPCKQPYTVQVQGPAVWRAARRAGAPQSLGH